MTCNEIEYPPFWENCPSFGNAVQDLIFPFKTILDDRYNSLVSTRKRFGINKLNSIISQNSIRIIIDMTPENKYYNSNKLKKAVYIRILENGYIGIPTDLHIYKFNKIIKDLINTDITGKIGVHDTYGYNNTGFMIVAYLVNNQNYRLEHAVKIFAEARPPGIFDAKYIEELKKLYDTSANITLPSEPIWMKVTEAPKSQVKRTPKPKLPPEIVEAPSESEVVIEEESVEDLPLLNALLSKKLKGKIQMCTGCPKNTQRKCQRTPKVNIASATCPIGEEPDKVTATIEEVLQSLRGEEIIKSKKRGKCRKEKVTAHSPALPNIEEVPCERHQQISSPPKEPFISEQKKIEIERMKDDTLFQEESCPVHDTTKLGSTNIESIWKDANTEPTCTKNQEGHECGNMCTDNSKNTMDWSEMKDTTSTEDVQNVSEVADTSQTPNERCDLRADFKVSKFNPQSGYKDRKYNDKIDGGKAYERYDRRDYKYDDRRGYKNDDRRDYKYDDRRGYPQYDKRDNKYDDRRDFPKYDRRNNKYDDRRGYQDKYRDEGRKDYPKYDYRQEKGRSAQKRPLIVSPSSTDKRSRYELETEQIVKKFTIPKFFINTSKIYPVKDPIRVEILKTKVMDLLQLHKHQSFGTRFTNLTRKNFENFKQGKYLHSWITSGRRYLLYVVNKFDVYLIDGKNSFFKVSELHFPSSKDSKIYLKNTLFDGEFVIDRINNEDVYMYLISNIYFFEGEFVDEPVLLKRLFLIESITIRTRKVMLKKEKVNQSFEIGMKKFLNKEFLGDVWNKLRKKVPHTMTGLIFYPETSEKYKYMKFVPVYVWQPPEYKTVNFILKNRIDVDTNGLIGEIYVRNAPGPYAQILNLNQDELKNYDNAVIQCMYNSADNSWTMVGEQNNKVIADFEIKDVLDDIQNPLTFDELTK